MPLKAFENSRDMLSGLKPRWMTLFGALLGLSAPGFHLWILAWIGLIPVLFWVKRQSNWQTVFWGGFWFGFCFQGIYCSWFFDLHPLTWLGFTEWGSRLTTLAGWLLITVEGGLITAAVLSIYYFLNRPYQWLIFPFLWVFGFSLLHVTPLALPWGLLEYTQASLPLIRWLAGWLGASGLAFLLVLHNAAWTEYLDSARSKWQWTLIALVPIAVWLLGVLPFFDKPAHFPITIAAIQANLPIEVVRSGRLTVAEIDAAYLRPLKEKPFSPNSLVVYPEEGVVPGVIAARTPLRNPIMAQLQKMANQKQVFIAVGVIVQEQNEQLYNSIALLSPSQSSTRNAVQFYHKRKLVPFGEFTPYGFGEPLKELLAQWRVNYHAPFSNGKTASLLQVNGVPVGGLVCFELIDASPLTGGFSGDYQRRGAKLLLNVSNLGWFHENPLMEAQFLAIGQLRAAENRLPLVIASNTGISAVLSEQGRVMARTQPFSQTRFQTQVIVYPNHEPRISFK